MAREYARAALSLAQAEGAAADLEGDCRRLGVLLEQEPRLRAALTDPSYPREARERFLEELFRERLHPLTLNFLRFLILQGRAREVASFTEEVLLQAAQARRRVLAEVRTAEPLEEEQRERLVEALEKATGMKVELKEVVERGLLGGVVVKVGDRVFDGSVKGRLGALKEALERGVLPG